MYETIVVPTDGSEAADTALESALTLARRFDATVHGVYVLDVEDVHENLESELAGELTGELTDHGESVLQSLQARADEAGVDCTTAFIDTGEATHRAILDTALDIDADIIAMGTHGRTGLNRLVLGSVTERTLRTSSVPVLTVHADTPLRDGFDRILVPTDGSDEAAVAAQHSITLAGDIGASLHIVHVVDVTGVAGDGGSAVLVNELQEYGRQTVDSLADRAKEGGIEAVDTSVMVGTPVRGILNKVEDTDADLIILGTHGRTGLSRYLLGSVTEKVVRMAEVPVLTTSLADDATS